MVDAASTAAALALSSLGASMSSPFSNTSSYSSGKSAIQSSSLTSDSCVDDMLRLVASPAPRAMSCSSAALTSGTVTPCSIALRCRRKCFATMRSAGGVRPLGKRFVRLPLRTSGSISTRKSAEPSPSPPSCWRPSSPSSSDESSALRALAAFLGARGLPPPPLLSTLPVTRRTPASDPDLKKCLSSLLLYDSTTVGRCTEGPARGGRPEETKGKKSRARGRERGLEGVEPGWVSARAGQEGPLGSQALDEMRKPTCRRGAGGARRYTLSAHTALLRAPGRAHARATRIAHELGQSGPGSPDCSSLREAAHPTLP